METSYKKTKDFLLNNDSWLFISLAILFSYVFMQQSHQLGWRTFYGILLGLTLFSLPVLLFTFFRNTIKWNPLYYWFSSAVVFLICPSILLFICKFSFTDLVGVPKTLSFPTDSAVLTLRHFAIVTLALELFLQLLKQRNRRFTLNWLINWSIPKLAVFIVLVFAVTLVPISNYFQEATQNLTGSAFFFYYLKAVIQTFFIYISYYLIYHVHHHFLFNVLLRQKGLLYYLLGSLAFLLLFVPIQNQYILLFPAVSAFKIHPLGLVPQIFADLSFTLPLFFFILTIPFIVIVEWYRQANAINTLEKEKTATELQLLKQQINPHFFFNTLNNLYAMSLTQEKETPETIMKLSELMRYVIYKGQEEQVQLHQEVKYLQDYLDLQQIRLHKKLDLKFKLDIADQNTLVPPLLFIILVENAFKHGIEPADGDRFLHILLKQRGKVIEFHCHNSKENTPNQAEAQGIGLKNLKRRLEVRFPGSYSLDLDDNRTDYKAKLILNA